MDWLEAAAGFRATAKDFRTWHGSVHALALLLHACAGGDGPDQACRNASAIVAAVARRLGNTAAVCRKAYIHPAVLALADALAESSRRRALLRAPWVAAPARSPSALLRTERQLLALLHGVRRGATVAGTAAPSPTNRPRRQASGLPYRPE